MARILPIVTATASLMIAALVTAPATNASVIDNDHYVDAGVDIVDDFCGSGITFRDEFNYLVRFMSNTHGPGAVYFAARFHGSDVFTNLDTGKSLTLSNNVTFRDHRITINDDGTLTIVQQATGIQITRDDSGQVLFRDRGVTRFKIVIDYNGTLYDTSDDILVDDSGIIFVGGKFDTMNRDFCEDVLNLTA